MKTLLDVKVMVNGLPGKMAKIIAQGIFDLPNVLPMNATSFSLLDLALTGPNQPKKISEFKNMTLFGPEDHEKVLAEASNLPAYVCAIDACKGAGVANRNAEMYCRHHIPFVMLSTTDVDYKLIEKLAEETMTPCVACPNMDVRIVAWMAGIQHMAENYLGAFENSKIFLTETHQADKVNADGKPETSGTMNKALKNLSALLGEELTADQIISMRDPNVQAKIIGVPKNWLGWHAYHFFKVSNEHDGVEDSEELIFKRHGGECYRRGTMLALDFLAKEKNEKYFNTMIDVIKG
ncbi:MAG: hypothetical protein PHN74_00970 [Candidatus Pacebacteria bacterium]|nr:hypothetical protein [Candidatus Paceibacterota bacterium]